jgi:hypothetical protein
MQSLFLAESIHKQLKSSDRVEIGLQSKNFAINCCHCAQIIKDKCYTNVCHQDFILKKNNNEQK